MAYLKSLGTSKIKKFLCFFSILVVGIFIGEAKAQLTFKGKVVGTDQNPLEKALLMAEGPHNFSFSEEIKPDGSFKIVLPRRGGYYLYFIGIHHKPITIPVIVDDQKEVTLDVRMQSMKVKQLPDSVYIIGSFNDYSTEEGKKLMQKKADGTFSKQVTTDADSIAYQLWGVTETEFGRTYPISGTEKSAQISTLQKTAWQDGHFVSVKRLIGKQGTIHFNPDKLAASNKEEKIVFSDPTLNQMVSIYRDVESKEQQFGLAVRTDTIDAAKLLRKFQAEYKEVLQKEKNPFLRQLVLIRYFDELNPVEDDSVLANQLLEEVPPTSPFWSLSARSTTGASNIMFRVSRTSTHQEEVDNYIDQGINQHPDPDVKAQFLYVGFNRAESNNNKKRMNRFYNELKTNYAETYQHETIKRQFGKNRKIQVGNQIPDFRFIALNDTTTIYTDEFFRGTTYLIDFWGTWCGPCIEELPYLQKAYKKYKDQGFEILSVAMLDNKSNIKEFRNEGHAMPWHHTLVERENNAKINKLFEITGIPRPILISEKGEIIALNEQIRGNKLLNQLNKIFNK